MDSRDILEGFNAPKAKIDFITLATANYQKWAGDPALNKELEAGRIELIDPRRSPNNDIAMTLHDPSPAPLIELHNKAPDLMIWKLEIAIDWTLKDGSNDLGQLQVLRRHLVQNLSPTLSGKFIRKYWTEYGQRNAVIKDHAQTRSTNTAYWTEARNWQHMRCYIKTQDHGRPIDTFCVRLELTLSQGALSDLNAHRMCLLPDLISNLQQRLSSYFYVGAGVRLPPSRCRSQNPASRAAFESTAQRKSRKAARNWQRYGATFAQKRGFSVKPDSFMNRQIGRALQGLKERFQYHGFVPQICPKIRERYRTEYHGIQ